MIAVVLASISAFISALENILIRRYKHIDTEIVNLYKMCFFVLILLPLLFYNGINIKSVLFFPVVLFTSFMFNITSIMYIRSIQLSGISHTVPLISITPIFTLLVSFFILNEVPNLISFSGVILVVIGAYVLNISRQKEGLFEPFRFLLKEEGLRMMLIVAIMFGFLSTMFKFGVLLSDPITMMTIEGMLIVIWIAIYTRTRGFGKKQIIAARKYWPVFLGLGLTVVLADLSLAYALRIMFAGYVIAIKRLNILFSVVFGWLLFKEKNVGEKLIGSIIMIAGVVIISLFS